MTHASPGNRDQPLVETRLRLVTWNLWWRFGDWRRRQPLIVEALRAAQPDLVALQEVWDDGTECQAARLAEALGLHWTYEPVLAIDGIDWGMAILARWPIAAAEGLALPSMPSDDGARDCRAMRARVAGPRGAIDAYCTHLSWRPEESTIRQRQAGALSRWIAATAEPEGCPPILCGDLNAIPTADEIRMLTGEAAVPVEGLVFLDAWRAAGHVEPGFTWDDANPWTHPALQPNRRLDYALIAPPAANGTGHVLDAHLIGDRPDQGGIYPSDHFGVVVDVRY